MGKAKPKTYRKERNHSNVLKFKKRIAEVKDVLDKIKLESKINSESK